MTIKTQRKATQSKKIKGRKTTGYEKLAKAIEVDWMCIGEIICIVDDALTYKEELTIEDIRNIRGWEDAISIGYREIGSKYAEVIDGEVSYKMIKAVMKLREADKKSKPEKEVATWNFIEEEIYEAIGRAIIENEKLEPVLLKMFKLYGIEML